MSRKRKFEVIRCTHFQWRLVNRRGIWYADGRSNSPNPGRHSLGTKNRTEAMGRLVELDLVRAVVLGLAQPPANQVAPARPLALEEGRALYTNHISRPRIAGGVRSSTAKRYRSTFDKFLPFARGRGIEMWHQVSAQVLTAYAKDLQDRGYAQKTQSNELVLLKQTFKWLIAAEHLVGVQPINLKLRKPESERPYCWRVEEVRAMVEHCQSSEPLKWLRNVVIALACTGLRISELISLRWTDIDLDAERLLLTDETAHPDHNGQGRELKSGRSRSFPIHPALRSVLESVPRSGRFIFYGPRGGRLKADTVRRALVRDVLAPLAARFPSPDGGKGFRDGRLHSFRHYFCSTCANSRVPEQMLMDWVGHADSEMVRNYYHLHDQESRRQMEGLDFLGGADGCSAGTE